MKRGWRSRRIGVVVALVVLMLVLAATMALPALAGGETDERNPKNGWGTVVSQKASNSGGIGEHGSSQDEPRRGVGNVAREDDGRWDHLGDHGCFVGAIDGAENTDCTGDPGPKR
jgi:hypothetical protein